MSDPDLNELFLRQMHDPEPEKAFWGYLVLIIVGLMLFSCVAAIWGQNW